MTSCSHTPTPVFIAGRCWPIAMGPFNSNLHKFHQMVNIILKNFLNNNSTTSKVPKCGSSHCRAPHNVWTCFILWQIGNQSGITKMLFIVLSSWQGKVHLGHLNDCQSAPGGHQLIGQAENLAFLSLPIGCYRPMPFVLLLSHKARTFTLPQRVEGLRTILNMKSLTAKSVNLINCDFLMCIIYWNLGQIHP